MNSGLVARALALPGAKACLDQAVEDLGQRRNVILVAGPDVPAEMVWSSLRGDLWRAAFDMCEVDVSSSLTPGATLTAALGVSSGAEGESFPCAALLQAQSVPDVVWLRDVSTLDEDLAALWLSFIAAWGQQANQYSATERYRPVFCVLVSSSRLVRLLPPGDVRLSVRWLWGLSSELDLRTLCRTEHDAGCLRPAALWREHVLPSLACGDLDLAAFLWDSLETDFAGIVTKLRECATKRGWSPQLVRQAARVFRRVSQGGSVRPDSAGLPKELLSFWADGFVSFSPERGVELNTAALVLLDQLGEVRHRLWQGQVALILPLLDEVRRGICGHLTRTYGADWPVRWERPESPDDLATVVEDAALCQLGHLEHLLRRCPALAAERHWLSVVQLARFMRNELAHFRPVTYRDYAMLWDHAYGVPHASGWVGG